MTVDIVSTSKNLAWTLTALIGLAGMTLPVQAADQPEPPVPEPPVPELRIVVVEFPPEILKNRETGEAEGQATIAVGRLASMCGLKARFIMSPSWRRAYSMALTGTAHAIMPLNHAPEREADFIYRQEPVFQMRTMLVVHRSSPLKRFRGLSDLDGLRVGKLDNSLIEPAFDAYIQSGKAILSERATFDQVMLSVARKRLDVGVGEMTSYRHWASVLGIEDELRALEPPLGVVPQYLGLSRTAMRVSPLNDAALATCLASKYVD